MDPAATSLLHDLGYVIPTGISGVTLIFFIFFFKWQETKQDKDRVEHMKKWESVITMHKEAMQNLIDTHQREIDRQFRLQERNTSALEALAHQITSLTKDMR